jgi:hypothetical protein
MMSGMLQGGPGRASARSMTDRALIRALARECVFLFGVGMLAIGASGVLALAMRAAFGDPFVAGDPVGVTYTPSRCADFIEYAPHAADCEAAASAHHAGEVVDLRIAAGLLGAVVLATRWLVRRGRVPSEPPVLPEGFVATIGASLFGAAAVLLGGEGLGVLVFDGPNHGPGQWISAGVVSLVVFAAFAHLLWRTLTAARPSVIP